MVCIARKTLYSRVYLVCTHTKYMVSGDCTRGCALLKYAECTLPQGVSTPISMLNDSYTLACSIILHDSRPEYSHHNDHHIVNRYHIKENTTK